MKEVINTSPLIFLAKLGKLDFLEHIDVLIPTVVCDEIEAGRILGKEDFALLEKWLSHKRKNVMNTPLLSQLHGVLGKGEAAVISLALKQNVETVIIDEKKARAYARLYGLKPKGTLSILIRAIEQKRVSKTEGRRLVLELVTLGYRIKEDLLSEILKALG